MWLIVGYLINYFLFNEFSWIERLWRPKSSNTSIGLVVFFKDFIYPPHSIEFNLLSSWYQLFGNDSFNIIGWSLSWHSWWLVKHTALLLLLSNLMYGQRVWRMLRILFDDFFNSPNSWSFKEFRLVFVVVDFVEHESLRNSINICILQSWWHSNISHDR